VGIDEIAEVGDYIILNTVKSELKEVEPELKEEKSQKTSLKIEKID
jgi:hypothetical protein